MKLLTVSTLALTVAASGAIAQSNDTETDMNAQTNGEMSAQATENATDMDNTMSGDGAMAEDTEMSDDNAMASSGMNGRSDISGMTSADMGGMQGNLIRTRDITGGDVYTTNEANDEGWNSANVYDGVGDNWNQIGEIEDIVLTQDGQMAGIIAEVGGFLDIADKHVMVSVNDVSLVAVDNAEYAFVTRLNEEDLESMEGVDEGFWD